MLQQIRAQQMQQVRPQGGMQQPGGPMVRPPGGLLPPGVNPQLLMLAMQQQQQQQARLQQQSTAALLAQQQQQQQHARLLAMQQAQQHAQQQMRPGGPGLMQARPVLTATPLALAAAAGRGIPGGVARGGRGATRGERGGELEGMGRDAAAASRCAPKLQAAMKMRARFSPQPPSRLPFDSRPRRQGARRRGHGANGQRRGPLALGRRRSSRRRARRARAVANAGPWRGGRPRSRPRPRPGARGRRRRRGRRRGAVEDAPKGRHGERRR
jgi:hypothetical protein